MPIQLTLKVSASRTPPLAGGVYATHFGNEVRTRTDRVAASAIAW